MTGNQMKANLGLRLEDPGETVFTGIAKVDAINLAQRELVNLIDNAYLSELQTVSAATNTNSSGVKAFSAFSPAIDHIRNGIIAVHRIDQDTWMNIIDYKDRKRVENSYLAGTNTNPVCYFHKETIYCLPEAQNTVYIFYLKPPTDFDSTNTGTGEGQMNGSCMLNPALWETILDLAESQLWRMDGKSDRGQVAYNNAANTIKILNERFQKNKPEGIGTKGR